MPALLAGATAFGGLASVGSGISGMMASNTEAMLQRRQGDVALAEAKANATNEAFNQRIAIGKQKLAFLANGVSLEGSPSDVVKQSREYGQQQVQSILDQGIARKGLAYAQAAQTKAQGRAALIAGIGQGISTFAQGISSGYKAGLFGNTKYSPSTEGAMG